MPDFTDALRRYALAVHQRDKFKCRYCGLDGTVSFTNRLSLSVDHLFSYENLAILMWLGFDAAYYVREKLVLKSRMKMGYGLLDEEHWKDRSVLAQPFDRRSETQICENKRDVDEIVVPEAIVSRRKREMLAIHEQPQRRVQIRLVDSTPECECAAICCTSLGHQAKKAIRVQPRNKRSAKRIRLATKRLS